MTQAHDEPEAPVFDPDARPLFSDELEAYREESLAPCLDTTDLPQHFQRLPNDIGRWGRVLGNAHRHAAACEAHYRRIHGELYAEFTERLVALKGKATDKQVESMVRADPRYVAAKTTVGEADGLVAEVREILAGLRRKGDALVNMGSSARKEYDAQRVADHA